MLRAVLVSFCLSFWGVAATAERLAQAEALYAGGDAAGALQTVAEYQAGDAVALQRLMWLRALANMRLGQPAAALPDLERLVATYPRVPQYRLELAAALGRLGQAERALYHIEIARSADLPEAVDRRVAAYAQELENPQIFSGHISFAIVPESNAAKRTSATEVTLFGLPFVINPNVRARSATGLEVNAGLTASPRLGDGLTARFGASTRLRFFDGNAPDDYTARVFAGLVQGHLETGQTRAEIFATQRWLDKRDYSRSLGVTLAHARRLTPATRLDGQITREHLRYRTGARMQRNLGSIGLRHALNPQLEFRIAGRVERRSASQDTLAGRMEGITLGAQYRFEGGVQLGLTLDHERNRYDGLHPLFGVARDDRRSLARLDLAHSQWNWNGFAPVLRLSYERQRSTIILNDYRNLGASFGVTRRF